MYSLSFLTGRLLCRSVQPPQCSSQWSAQRQAIKAACLVCPRVLPGTACSLLALPGLQVLSGPFLPLYLTCLGCSTYTTGYSYNVSSQSIY